MGKVNACLFHHTIIRIQHQGYNTLELPEHRQFQILSGLDLIVNDRKPYG